MQKYEKPSLGDGLGTIFELKELFGHIISCLFDSIDTIIIMSQLSKR